MASCLVSYARRALGRALSRLLGQFQRPPSPRRVPEEDVHAPTAGTRPGRAWQWDVLALEGDQALRTAVSRVDVQHQQAATLPRGEAHVGIGPAALPVLHAA